MNARFSAGIAAGVVAFAAAAQPPLSQPAEAPNDPPAKFEALDQNGDNMISRPEASAHDRVNNQFRALDADADGDLDRGEFARFEIGIPVEPDREATPVLPDEQVTPEQSRR